ncbi:hypothetical protein Q5P01_000043 [Channa striata]|uniref:Uncharacterized protein n=1 Tax=Channa striata TaxID=64152 RepID=A0AA88IHT6_CHASR|nr:hypothetical protein Q5P01_000043 [Channa striata]
MDRFYDTLQEMYNEFRGNNFYASASDIMRSRFFRAYSGEADHLVYHDADVRFKPLSQDHTADLTSGAAVKIAMITSTKRTDRSLEKQLSFVEPNDVPLWPEYTPARLKTAYVGAIGLNPLGVVLRKEMEATWAAAGPRRPRRDERVSSRRSRSSREAPGLCVARARMATSGPKSQLAIKAWVLGARAHGVLTNIGALIYGDATVRTFAALDLSQTVNGFLAHKLARYAKTKALAETLELLADNPLMNLAGTAANVFFFAQNVRNVAEGHHSPADYYWLTRSSMQMLSLVFESLNAAMLPMVSVDILLRLIVARVRIVSRRVFRMNY